MNYIDIHTHKIADCECICIKNITLGKDDKIKTTPYKYSSIGIHPWYLQNNEESFTLLLEYSKKPNILAIGECGLDHLSDFPMENQKQIFLKQINLAEELHKPLIIHCVKAFNEIIKLKKQIKPKVPWIIHGFNANNIILKECLKHGLYISINYKLLFNKSANNIINFIPNDLLFLETDESKDTIQDMYNQAAFLKSISLRELKEKIYDNFVRIFKI